MPSGISRSNATVEQKKGKNREITTLFLYTIAAKNRNKNKVLFIYRCSKNWQKKCSQSFVYICLQMIDCTLPIFTAATDKKYFNPQ